MSKEFIVPCLSIFSYIFVKKNNIYEVFSCIFVHEGFGFCRDSLFHKIFINRNIPPLIISFFQSFTTKDCIISAQYPVPSASVDLIRLLVDHECSILVSMNPLSSIPSVTHTLRSLLIQISSYTGRGWTTLLHMSVKFSKYPEKFFFNVLKICALSLCYICVKQVFNVCDHVSLYLCINFNKHF